MAGLKLKQLFKKFNGVTRTRIINVPGTYSPGYGKNEKKEKLKTEFSQISKVSHSSS